MPRVIDKLNALEELTEAHQAGFLNDLMKAGIIPWQVIQQRDMYQHVHMLKKTKGISMYKAAREAAEAFRVGESTIYYALKRMRADA